MEPRHWRMRSGESTNTFKHAGIMSRYSGWLYGTFESVFLANRLRGRSLCGPATGRTPAKRRGATHVATRARRGARSDAFRARLTAPLRWALHFGRRILRPGRRVRLPGRVIV